MTKYVVWDVDDVLAQMAQLTVDRITQTGKTCPPVPEWTHYHFGKYIGLGELGYGLPEVIDWMVSNRLIEDCLPFPWTAQALARTHELGYLNAFCTARGWHPNGEDLTWDWVQLHGLRPLVQEVFVVQTSVCKTEALRNALGLDNIALFVEDSATNAITAHAAGVNIALIDTGWNRSVIKPLSPTFRVVSDALAAVTNLERFND